MRVDRIAEGLWGWTGLHPEWGESDIWPQDVACVYYEAPEAVVLIDPLIPPEDDERFLAALDRDVERAGRPVAILLTCKAHVRSAQELTERYGAFSGQIPAGVESFSVDWYDESAYWIPEHAALVTGDVLLGGQRDGVHIPTEWVQDDLHKVLNALRPLLDLPIERLLVSHGEPVLEGGRDALARALG